MSYRLIYDGTNESFGGWATLIFNLLFLGSLFLPYLAPYVPWNWFKDIIGKRETKYIWWLGLIVTLHDLPLSLYDDVTAWQEVRRAAQASKFEVIEGQITKYQRASSGGSSEYFIVNEQRFDVGSHHSNVGFGQKVGDGSPLKQGAQVKVGYIRADDAPLIVRLEIM